jgi:hypothetical protein
VITVYKIVNDQPAVLIVTVEVVGTASRGYWSCPENRKRFQNVYFCKAMKSSPLLGLFFGSEFGGFSHQNTQHIYIFNRARALHLDRLKEGT